MATVAVSKALIQKIKKAAFLSGSFTTRAGKKTDYYIDKYLFSTTPDILEPLAKALADRLPEPDTYDRIAAPELGAVAIAAAVSIVAKKPFIIVKKEVKAYGTQNAIEGAYEKGDRVVLLEDVLTTGGTVIKSIDKLTDLELSITKILTVIDREEGGIDAITEKGYAIDGLITASDLKSC